MQYDYGKVVTFLYGKEVSRLNDVMKVVLSNGFVMLDVNMNAKMILLEKNGLKYVLTKRNDRLIIFPDNYSALTFADDFGEIIEMSINTDGNVVVSNIFNSNVHPGVVATTSTWSYFDKLYSEVVSRVMFVKKDALESVNNRMSIEMFINEYYIHRNDVLSDLYWDFEMFRKNNFLEAVFSERIQINDGYSKEPFDDLYKRHMDKVLSVVSEKGKPSLF